MHITINKSQFRDAFHRAGRKDQFSYEALGLLFDYLEDCGDATGLDYELDVIAICCEFCEMSEEEVRDSYHVNSEDTDYFLQEHTIYIGATDAGHVFAQF